MSATLLLALRNLLRNRRRSITTLMALVVAVCAVLLFGGYSRDITYGLQTDFVQRSGHLQIQRAGYYKYGTGNAAAFGIRRYQALIDRLRADPVLAPMLVVVTPTLQIGGVAGNFAAGLSRTVFALGHIPVDQTLMRQWNDYRFPFTPQPAALTGTPEPSVVVGLGVARVLGLCAPLKVSDCDDHPMGGGTPARAGAADAPADLMALGQIEADATRPGTGPAASSPAGGVPRIEILAANTRGAPNVGSFEVARAIEQGVKEVDDVFVEMHLAAAQRLVYGREEPRVTAIMVQLQHTAQLPQARQRIEQLLAEHDAQGEPLQVLDFATLNPFYDQTNRMFDAIFGFVFALIAVIVLFVVSNTMTMAIVERTVEIGTLRSVGMRRAGIQRLFVAEGLLLGLVGATAGVAVSLLLAWAVNHSGLTWTPPARTNSIPLTVRVWGEWRMVVLTFVGLTVVAALSAWWPARRASRLPIVDALRHV